LAQNLLSDWLWTPLLYTSGVARDTPSEAVRAGAGAPLEVRAKTAGITSNRSIITANPSHFETQNFPHPE
jgi:hypothetical protein